MTNFNEPHVWIEPTRAQLDAGERLSGECAVGGCGHLRADVVHQPPAEVDPMADDPANAPVVHVAVYEYPSDYEDNEPIVRVGATRADALRAVAVEVDQWLTSITEELNPFRGDDDALSQAHGDAGALTADMDADALADWLGTATGNGGAYTVHTEPVRGATREQSTDLRDDLTSVIAQATTALIALADEHEANLRDAVSRLAATAARMDALVTSW
jgi:hypothetical protein